LPRSSTVMTGLDIRDLSLVTCHLSLAAGFRSDGPGE
jgi:hypothetical protein